MRDLHDLVSTNHDKSWFARCGASISDRFREFPQDHGTGAGYERWTLWTHSAYYDPKKTTCTACILIRFQQEAERG